MAVDADPDPSDPPSLDEFAARLDAARAARNKARGSRIEADDTNSMSSGMGMGFRVATELVVAVGIGTGLGFGFDTVADTAPWGVLVGFGIGMAAGFLNVRRAMDAINASINAPAADDHGAEDRGDEETGRER